MRPVSIARNYAEALFEVGERSRRTALYADMLEAVAGAISTSPRVQAVLMSPRIPKAAKSRLLAESLKDAPNEFVRFLQAVVKRGRQALFPAIATEYLALLDIKLNRVRAGVTLARTPDEALKKRIVEQLSAVMGKEVIARFEADPALLGGMVVRVGDRVFDGSLKRRMTVLRRRLLVR